MRLLLRSTSPAKYAPRYRGTDRDSMLSAPLPRYPYFDEIREIWDEYREHTSGTHPNIEQTEDLLRLGWVSPDVVRDLGEARWLVQAFRERVGQDLEVIEVTRGKAEPEVGGEFLGYDLSVGYDTSILSGGLDMEGIDNSDPRIPGDPYNNSLVSSLFKLLGKYFRPLLNAHGLFDSYEDAVFCLRCSSAIPYVSPESFDQQETRGREPHYEVLGIFRVH
jgi:hypothetical protein